MGGEADGAITEEGFRGWLPVVQAINLVASGTQDQSAAQYELLRRLSAGLTVARAEGAVASVQGKETNLGQYWRVPVEIWKDLSGVEYIRALPLWNANGVEVGISTGSGPYRNITAFKFFSIRLDPVAVKKAIPQRIDTLPRPTSLPPSDPQPEIAKVANRAGRLSKVFWEDMIIDAMTAMFFDGDLQPKSGADVQRWMDNWLCQKVAEPDHPGNTALKERAAKVFAAWQKSRK
jgi:hypothetical protein